MSILAALILGIIQGLTEFLPVSSSGHLMLVESLFGLEAGNMFFNVLMHLATLIAILVVLYKDIASLVRHPFSREVGMIVLACIPTAIIGLLVEIFFDEYLLAGLLGFGFLTSAVIVSLVCAFSRRKAVPTRELTASRALAIGFVQGLAVLPGISRSGSTICAGLLSGLEREKAAKFSFLISIPVILGGMVLETAKGIKVGFGAVQALPCIVGFVAAFITAMLTIRLMLKLVKKGSWLPFAIYLFALSAVVLLNQFVFAWF